MVIISASQAEDAGSIPVVCFLYFAGVAELADASDLGSDALRCAGSSPVARTLLPLVGAFVFLK